MQETKNTKKAEQDLKALTAKPIYLTTLEEEAKRTNTPYIRNWLGAAIEERDRFVIALNHEKPNTNEASFVHEVIHMMLSYSKYPRVSYDEMYASKNLPLNRSLIIPGLMGTFKSSIEHPEVYRRMNENYDLDMETYFQDLLTQKLNKIITFKYSSLNERIFLDQQTIVESIEYHYYSPSVKYELLKAVAQKSATGHEIASRLIEELDDNWGQSPEACLNAARLILQRVIQYGENSGLETGDNIWKALKVVPQ